jgi:hypothetical protein
MGWHGQICMLGNLWLLWGRRDVRHEAGRLGIHGTPGEKGEVILNWLYRGDRGTKADTKKLELRTPSWNMHCSFCFLLLLVLQKIKKAPCSGEVVSLDQTNFKLKVWRYQCLFPIKILQRSLWSVPKRQSLLRSPKLKGHCWVTYSPLR